MLYTLGVFKVPRYWGFYLWIFKYYLNLGDFFFKLDRFYFGFVALCLFGLIRKVYYDTVGTFVKILVGWP